MANDYPIDKMVRQIRSMKKSAIELQNLSGGIQAVDRNVDRVLASIRMLEINIVDVSDIVDKEKG